MSQGINQNELLGTIMKAVLVQAVQALPVSAIANAMLTATAGGAFALPTQEAPALPAPKRGRKPKAAAAVPAPVAKAKAAKKAANATTKAKAPKAGKKETPPRIRDQEAFAANVAKVKAVLEEAPGHALQASAVAQRLGIEKPVAAKHLKQMVAHGEVFQGGVKRYTVYALSSKEANAASIALKGGGKDEPADDVEIDPNAQTGEHAKGTNGAVEESAYSAI